MSTFRLESVNDSPAVEYRDLDGHPVPYMVTIQRRLAADPDDAYGWETISIRDVLEQLRRDTPVAEWLRTQTRVDCRPEVFRHYADLDDSAYLWNINAGK